MKSQNTILSLLFLFGLGLSTSAMDQNRHIYLELDSITYLEDEDVSSLDFDAEAYLPEEFNAYAAPENILHVSYISNELEVKLGFETQEYLPHDFDPYNFFFYIHSIEYIEDQEGVDPDSHLQKYFPENQDAIIGR